MNTKEKLTITLLMMASLMALTILVMIEHSRGQEIHLHEHHETTAVIEYCDRFNVCMQTEVDEFRIVYKQRLNNIVWLIEFELDGETIRITRELAKVVIQ